MSDDDAFDHTAVADLGEVLPPGLLPSTLGELRTLVRDLVRPEPADDSAASFGGALGAAVARLTAAQALAHPWVRGRGIVGAEIAVGG